jgi:catechol 2,3-dioxygenase-like lactoylglutathione lyase family enzyme
MIQHLTFVIRPSELARFLTFYGILGFEPVEPPPGIEGRAVWLERAGSQVHLMSAPPDAPAPEPASGHVGILVSAYREAVARLLDAGFEVEPRRAHWGSPRAYVRDPGGNLVELMAGSPAGPIGWPPSEKRSG